ncbi:MAG: cysteine desulfurase [Spirochaetota bacterium]|nr:cysteine desulfurase [Spirochaetota bacterium]
MTAYLDYNATTPLDDRVREAMIKSLEDFGNPSSSYETGRKVRLMIDSAREELASFIGAESGEIVFSSGATESNNMAILGVMKNESLTKKGDHLITTAIEHPSVLNVCESLEKEGYELSYVPVDKDGIVNPEDIRRSIKENTRLISVMAVNNEIGSIQPLEDIVGIAKEKGVIVHTDAVQAIGKLGVDVKSPGVDLLSMSAHKIYGPKGIGALYIRRGLKLKPLSFGGSHEKGRRPGTENSTGIAGFAECIRCLKDEMTEESLKISRLRERLENGIIESIADVRVNGHPEKRVPGTLSVSFGSVDGQAILLQLDSVGISVSTGSACKSGSGETSRVLSAIGLSEDMARSTIRFSVGRFSDEDQVDYVLEKLPGVISSLRALLP